MGPNQLLLVALAIIVLSSGVASESPRGQGRSPSLAGLLHRILVKTRQPHYWYNQGSNQWDDSAEADNQWDDSAEGGNQWDHAAEAETNNHWHSSAGAGNQWDDTVAGGNNWDNNAAGGNHWDDNAAGGNNWDDNAAGGNHWDDNAAGGNHWDHNAAGGNHWHGNAAGGNQWDDTGASDNQGDGTGTSDNQGGDTGAEEAGNSDGAESGWSHAGFSTDDQCSAVPLRGDQYSQQSIASDDLPVKPNCGLRLNTRSLLELLLQVRIVGGQQSEQGQWPWLAAMGSKADGQSCGATLISNQWVLTAAHCFEGQTIKPCDQNVRLGEHHLNLNDGQQADFTPSLVINHPEYDKSRTVNDIALIKLSKPVAMSDYVNVACLPSDTNDIDKTSCVVAGWGAINNKGDSSNIVKHVTAPILSQSTCEQAYPGSIEHGMMCAGHLQGGKDSCQGDSGGPLMCKSRTTGRYVVAGVVSWGAKCGGKGTPGVYTDVLKYIDWIEWVISKN